MKKFFFYVRVLLLCPVFSSVSEQSNTRGKILWDALDMQGPPEGQVLLPFFRPESTENRENHVKILST